MADIDSGTLSALFLGFLMGLKHATDADHVVAVSTIASEYRNAWRGIWVGGSWGLGHTTPLLVTGIIILLFKEVALDRYHVVTPFLEFGVGVMLLYLGIQVFWNLKRGRLHVHEHSHDGGPHLHIHATHDSKAGVEVETPHGFWHLGKPFFRFKSYSIGIVHGLAGSAAVMLLILPGLSSFWTGIGYLVLFGVGTILSMATMTVLLGIPFVVSSRFQHMNRVVAGMAGVASAVLGAALMSDTSLGTRFIPF